VLRRGHAHRVAANAGKACSPTTDAHTNNGRWRHHGRASLNDPDTLAAALSNALATSAGCCIDAASTLHRRCIDATASIARAQRPRRHNARRLRCKSGLPSPDRTAPARRTAKAVCRAINAIQTPPRPPGLSSNRIRSRLRPIYP
jgi:hypothetical protein